MVDCVDAGIEELFGRDPAVEDKVVELGEVFGREGW